MVVGGCVGVCVGVRGCVEGDRVWVCAWVCVGVGVWCVVSNCCSHETLLHERTHSTSGSADSCPTADAK